MATGTRKVIWGRKANALAELMIAKADLESESGGLYGVLEERVLDCACRMVLAVDVRNPGYMGKEMRDASIAELRSLLVPKGEILA